MSGEGGGEEVAGGETGGSRSIKRVDVSLPVVVQPAAQTSGPRVAGLDS